MLTQAEYEALCWAIREIDRLVFYKGGCVAGVSQRRKHLQLIPVQKEQDQQGFPIETILPDTLPLQPQRLLPLPFSFYQLIAAIPHNLMSSSFSAGDDCHRLYRKILNVIRIGVNVRNGIEYQPAPLLPPSHRRWMMVVPRGRAHYETISINAMAFAGSLFVRNHEEPERIREVRPLTLLKAARIQVRAYSKHQLRPTSETQNLHNT